VLRPLVALVTAITLAGGSAAYGAQLPRLNSERQWSLGGVERRALLTDPSVVIAVLDTGITPHPDLGWKVSKDGRGRPSGMVLPGYDFISDPWSAGDGDGWDSDPSDRGDGVRISQNVTRPECKARVSSWHGTNVAGTIAGQGTSPFGVEGIAKGSRIVPVRIMGRCGGNTADVAAGILWAAGHPVPNVPANKNPARIINLSLSGKSPTCPKSLQTAIDIADSLGSVVVAAAGSSGVDTRDHTPANCENVVVVGAVDRNDRRSPTSNYGTEVTISAPGGNMAVRESDGIYTTTNSGRYRPRVAKGGYYQGSSAAAAHVSGVLALVLSRQPQLTSSDLRSIVTQNQFLDSFTTGKCDVGDGLCGVGILRLEKVVAAFPRR
jgi:serine protease